MIINRSGGVTLSKVLRTDWSQYKNSDIDVVTAGLGDTSPKVIDDMAVATKG